MTVAHAVRDDEPALDVLHGARGTGPVARPVPGAGPRPRHRPSPAAGIPSRPAPFVAHDASVAAPAPPTSGGWSGVATRALTGREATLTLGAGPARHRDPGLVGEHDRLDAIADPELHQQPGDVRLDPRSTLATIRSPRMTSPSALAQDCCRCRTGRATARTSPSTFSSSAPTRRKKKPFRTVIACQSTERPRRGSRSRYWLRRQRQNINIAIRRDGALE